MSKNVNAGLSRREFVGLGIAGLSMAAILKPGRASAEDLPLVDPATNPQATALGYVHDSSTVDKAKFPKHEATQSCATCQFYQGQPGAETGPCLIFPGMSVKATGWCNSWAQKVG